MRITRLFLPVFLAGLVTVVAAPGQDQSVSARTGWCATSATSLPLYFLENRGQLSGDVCFYVHGKDKTLYFGRKGVTFALQQDGKPWVVKLDFLNTRPGVGPRGQDRQNTTFSFFSGPQKDWNTGVHSYGKLVYADLWPGIDLVYSGTASRVKYAFVVKPGADPTQIQLRYRGARDVRIMETGALRIETPAGYFEDAPPVAYQEQNGNRVPVDMAYELTSNHEQKGHAFSFRIGRYDRSRPLVLDPAILMYCGFLGGSNFDWVNDLAVDAAGNVYVVGYTMSSPPSFPVKVGPGLTFGAGIGDAFVAKINPTGTAIVYCGYIGGTGDDYGQSVFVDAAGNAYVAGTTTSTESTGFPVAVGPDLTANGKQDAFIAKVNPSGTGLVYCGFIGGQNDERGSGVAADSAGNAYLTGSALSDQTTFPVRMGPDTTYNGPTGHVTDGDAFVAKVSPTGASLVYCGYIGGSERDDGYDIAVDRTGHAYVVGTTASLETTFPVRVGPFLRYMGGTDTFIAKVSPTGTSLVYCGYIGGSNREDRCAVCVNDAGNAFVAGTTNSANLPTKKIGPDLTANGQYDAFVARVNTTGTGFDYCGFIGGSNGEGAAGIAVDAAGNAFVTGYTGSDENTFPASGGPDLTFNGGIDTFVAKVDASGSSLQYAGYIGGSGYDWGHGVGVDPSGNVYVTGQTSSDQSTFPVLGGPDLTHNGRDDTFVAKIVVTTATLTSTSTPRIGTRVVLDLNATKGGGLNYVIASSFGSVGIPIGYRTLPLTFDTLFAISIFTPAPVFENYSGTLNASGQGTAAINLPGLQALVGITIHSAFVTLDAGYPMGVRHISDGLPLKLVN